MSLIRPTWMLTAAGCFAENPDRPALDEGAPAHAGQVTFPGHAPIAVTYLVPRGDRDLVVGKLATPVTDVTPIKPAATQPTTNTSLQAVEYGRTATEWVTDTQHTAALTLTSTTDTTLVTNTTEGHVCKGDAGGPSLNAQGEIVAVHSRSGQAGCLGVASGDSTTGEARVDNIASWLRRNTFETLSKPALSVASDSWHVNATLPGTDQFVYVIKVTGQPDTYTTDQTSPLFLDPQTYGGKTVLVSARAAGPETNPWATPVTFTVNL